MLAQIFRSLALMLQTATLCVLPATNTALPWSTFSAVPVMTMVAFGFWILSRSLLRDFPRGRELLLWAGVFLLGGYGWAQVCFPSAMVDYLGGTILQLDAEPWTAFGTIDYRSSMRAMMIVTVVLMNFLMALHFGCQRTGRMIMAVAVTVGGLEAAAAGLWFQTGVDRSVLWQVRHVPASVFGFFWYHGSAAAFLNLSWPVGVWLILVQIQGRAQRWSVARQCVVALAATAVLVQIIAVFVNASKMGHLLMLMQLALLGAATGRLLLRHFWFESMGIMRPLLAGMLLLVMAGVGAWLTGANHGWARWQAFVLRGWDDPARRHAAEMAVRIGADAGWTGTGPGTFEWVSPHYSMADPMIHAVRWRHAHNDYAQFFAEWGGLGWLIMLAASAMPLHWLFGHLLRALSMEKSCAMSSQRRLGILSFATSLVGALIHAIVDFPLQIMAIQVQFAVLAALGLAMVLPAARGSTAVYRESRRPSMGMSPPPATGTIPAYFLSGD